MQVLRVAIAGFGNVGRSFARFVLNNPAVQIIAVADSSGFQAVHSNSHLEEILVAKESSEHLGIAPAHEGQPETLAYLADLSAKLGASIIVEALPTNIKSGQPGLDLICSALSKGLNVVTVDKGPMVRGFDVLMQAAERTGTRLAYTGTIGVAIPEDLAGSEVLEIRGVLNGTTNYILTEMQSGVAYQEALVRA
ncbi:MAG: hypothetical protein ACREDR_04865, partial [Blastocatellia bacterium]